jgi:ABC-2 type transport system permease protein
MTTVIPTASPASSVAATSSPTYAARFRWSWRLLRRGAVLMWLTVAIYMAVEVLVFRGAYPDQASRQKLLELSTSTAVRMMQGAPGAVDTAGGFAVWDGGWMLMLIVGSWALLTVARLTRGEEDSGRAELVLSRPVTGRRVLAANLSTMAVASIGIGLAAAFPFIVLGEPAGSALLWGAGLGAFSAVATSLGALTAQVVEPRRRVISAGLGLVAAAFLLRIVSNSADHRAWLLTVTPFGWVDRLRVFTDDRWRWLAAPVVAALVLGGSAVVLCGRRDTGAALLRSRATHRSSVHLLDTATAFGWRLASGALLAWTLILAIITLVFGLMTDALVQFINDDETYRRLLESMGMDMSVPVAGFLSYIAVVMALPFAVFTGWRLGAMRQEEADGRLDNLLVRGVVRWRWLTVTTVHAFLAAAILVLATGAALWTGARLVNAPVTVWRVVEPMAGTLPLVALFTGISVLVFGVAPRLTVAAPVTLAVVGFLLDTFGTALQWPHAVLALSPFHHLARLPTAPMTVTAVLVMIAVGLAASALGIVAFVRRDLRGA